MDLCEPPCSITEHLFSSCTCLDSCESSMITSTEDFGYVCSSPCYSPHDYYYLEIMECKSSCRSLFISGGDLYYTCYESNLDAPLSVVRMLQYTRCINITYPFRLRNYMTRASIDVVPIRYTFNMSSSMQDEFTRHSLPEVFSRYDLHSSFIVNFWPNLISFLMVVALATLLIILETLSKKRGWISLTAVLVQLRNLTA